MKVTLEFNLPDEKDEMETAMESPALRYVIDEFDGWLRNERKHVELGAIERAYLKKVTDAFREIKGEGPLE